jgi:hypothetical protein
MQHLRMGGQYVASLQRYGLDPDLPSLHRSKRSLPRHDAYRRNLDTVLWRYRD